MTDTGPGPSVALVAVGNELLYGETVDTNSAWLGRRLGAWGHRVVAGFTVRDEPTEICRAVAAAMEAADRVIVTGGLGPTRDDVTKQAVADLLGLSLIADPDVLRALELRFGAAGHQEVPPLSRGQALVPAGATPLPNDYGTAPGILIPVVSRSGGPAGTEGTIVLLPGVPREMRSIVDGPLSSLWAPRDDAGVYHEVIHTTGIAESRLAALVEEALAATPGADESVALAFLPDECGVDLRLTVEAPDRGTAEAALLVTERVLAPVVEPWRFEADSGDLAEAVARELRLRRLRMVSAESCTGGLVAKRMTDAAGASDVFLGAIVAYDNAVKIGQLGVAPAVLEAEGAVSEAVALAMASGALERLGADVGVAITGVAGPGGGSEEKPVGLVWLATAAEGRADATRRQFVGDRGSIRRQSAQAALAQLYRRLLQMDDGA